MPTARYWSLKSHARRVASGTPQKDPDRRRATTGSWSNASTNMAVSERQPATDRRNASRDKTTNEWAARRRSVDIHAESIAVGAHTVGYSTGVLFSYASSKGNPNARARSTIPW